MSGNPEVTRLKEVSDQAFGAKKAAYDHLKSIGRLRSDLKERMDASWRMVNAARSDMNAAYERQQDAWEFYRRERDNISDQIDHVARLADDEHRMGRECAEASQYAYGSGDKESAAMHKADKANHYYRRDSFNAEKARLISIAKSMTPPQSDFQRYKERYDGLMAAHKALQGEYQSVKGQHEEAKSRFEEARSRHEVAQGAFQRAVEAERAKWKSARCKWCYAEFKVNSDWSNPPELCRDCQDKIKAGKEAKTTFYRRFRTNHEPISIPAQIVWNRHDAPDTQHHLTMKYADGYRVSWNATRYGDYGFHWTNENVRGGPLRHVPPDDATVR